MEAELTSQIKYADKVRERRARRETWIRSSFTVIGECQRISSKATIKQYLIDNKEFRVLN